MRRSGFKLKDAYEVGEPLCVAGAAAGGDPSGLRLRSTDIIYRATGSIRARNRPRGVDAFAIDGICIAKSCHVLRSSSGTLELGGTSRRNFCTSAGQSCRISECEQEVSCVLSDKTSLPCAPAPACRTHDLWDGVGDAKNGRSPLYGQEQGRSLQEVTNLWVPFICQHLWYLAMKRQGSSRNHVLERLSCPIGSSARSLNSIRNSDVFVSVRGRGIHSRQNATAGMH